MDEYLSPSARRAVEAAAAWAARLAVSQIEPAHLLLGITEQEESRGALFLAAHGITCETICGSLGIDANTRDSEKGRGQVTVFSPQVRQLLSAVRGRSTARSADNPAGTDVLLLELFVVSPDLSPIFVSHGIDLLGIRANLEREIEAENRPLAAEFSDLDLTDATDSIDVYRILDAAANRAREGLRVLEDYARFVCDDPLLTVELKAVRHNLKEALDRLPRHELLASRETERDVGTKLSTEGEWSRNNPLDVVAANFKRVQEALRSLEEFGKLECRPVAAAMESARYRLYTLERAALIGAESRSRLDGVVLYVLVSSDRCPGGLEWTVRESLAGGAQAIQLREKSLADRELIALAHRVRRWTRETGALFIMNDRTDIARLVDADGVHVGQDELSVKDARRIVGPRALVGVSTHSIEQARQAALDGANYIGVGPTFPSVTKSFDSFPGLELVRQVHAEIRLPTFVIGGVTADHLEDVLAAGASRVAVSAAICASADPRSAAQLFRNFLCRNSAAT
jgi:thiamine-phosphate pyrophosphorylase